jgi:pimeloyl-ACP methyl ester carboxylesterase
MTDSSGIFFEEHGPKQAATILFLHGGGVGSWMWQPQLARLSDYHLLIPDLPGHGNSAHLHLESIEDIATRMAELIHERAHDRQAHVVGLSLGAQAVVYMLAQAPEMIDRAVVSSAILKPLPHTWLYNPGFLRFLFNTTVAPFRNSRWWARINMKYSGGLPEEFFPQYYELFRSMTADQFIDVLRVGLWNRIPKGLEKVKNQTLVLCGQKESREMHESTRAVAAALLNGKAFEVAYPKGVPMRAQHSWSMVYPDLFTRTIRNWIERKTLPVELLPL